MSTRPNRNRDQSTASPPKTLRHIQRLAQDWPAKAIALVVAIILYFAVSLTGVEERYITVPVQLVLSNDLVVAEEYSRFVRVYLRGKPDDIFAITENEITVVADFSQHNQAGIFRSPLTHSRQGVAEAMEAVEVRLAPDALAINLEPKTVLELNVLPKISTSPAAGYELTSYTTIPLTVKVAGPESVVDGLLEVMTEDVDLSGQNSSLTTRVSLVAPHPLIVFEDTSFVELRAEINESILVNTFDNISLAIIGLPPGLRVDFEDLKGSIRVQASQSLINQTSPESIGLVVDGGGITRPGSYTLPVRPIVPRGFVVFRFDPVELVVDIQESAQ